MPSARWDLPELPLLTEQEPRSPEELEALRKRAEKEVRTKLGSAIELVEIGDVVSYEFLEKELAIRERLDVMIARAYKKLGCVQSIKSLSPPALPAPSQPLLEKAA
jgi:hypothetical protein